MTIGSHIHKVPTSAAVERYTAVWTYRDRASTLGRTATRVHAIANSQSITSGNFCAFRKHMTAGVRKELSRRIGIYFRIYSYLVCLLTCSYIRIKRGIHVTEAYKGKKYTLFGQ